MGMPGQFAPVYRRGRANHVVHLPPASQGHWRTVKYPTLDVTTMTGYPITFVERPA